MLQLLNLNKKCDVDKYNHFFSLISDNNPYFLLDYIKVFSNRGDNLICFAYQSTQSLILLPGYLNRIKYKDFDNYFDFISPYGYTGPYYSLGTSNSDLKDFWLKLDSWYLKNNVVSEFIRFSLYGNEKGYSGKLMPTMLNIKGLIIDKELQWKEFDYKVRKNVSRAQNESLTSQIYLANDITLKQIEDFYNVYIHTMQRTNADKSFYYPFNDIVYFVTNNPGRVAFCIIYDKNVVISTEMVLISTDSIFSFLGGTDDTFFNKRPNDLLKFELINWARGIGKRYYVLGGGFGFEDGIFKYKQSFFPNNVMNFYTGRKIVNKDIYSKVFELNNIDRNKKGLPSLKIDDDSFFPIYNKKD